MEGLERVLAVGDRCEARLRNGGRLLCETVGFRNGRTLPLMAQLVAALQAQCDAQGMSSAHALFLTAAEQSAFVAAGWLAREDVQFHWHNRGYANFDDYLAGMRAEKRKQLRRERRRVTANRALALCYAADP